MSILLSVNPLKKSMQILGIRFPQFGRKEPHATLSFIYTKNSCIDFEIIQPKATKKQEINTKSCMCRAIFPNKTE